MIRDLISALLPSGEFVNFADICKGDTIVRGGRQFNGNKLDLGASIMRAWDLQPYKAFTLPEDYVDETTESTEAAKAAHDTICNCGEGLDPGWVDLEISEWFNDTRGLGGTVALYGTKMDEQPWHYRLNLTNPIPTEVPTNEVWLKQITSLFLSNSNRFTRIAYDDITEGDMILTFNAEAGDITDDHFIGEIHFGQIGSFEEGRGWFMRATETEDTDFFMALDPHESYPSEDLYYLFK